MKAYPMTTIVDSLVSDEPGTDIFFRCENVKRRGNSGTLMDKNKWRLANIKCLHKSNPTRRQLTRTQDKDVQCRQSTMTANAV